MRKNKLLLVIGLFFVLILAYFLVHSVRAGLVSGFSDQLSTQVIDSGSNHNINFTISSDMAANETLELFFESDYDLSLIDYTDIDLLDDSTNLNLGATAGTGAGSNIGVSISGQTINFTQNDADAIVEDSEITILIGTETSYQTTGDQQIYNPSVSGRYRISISGDFGDMGTTAVYILDTDSVALEAAVIPELRFLIRNETDTANINSCSLGTITSTGISNCSYRLAAETNAVNGFQVYISADGDFRNLTDSITNISENTQVEQGTEGYGLAITAADGILEKGDFTDDETPIPQSDTLLIESNLVYNYTEGDLSTSNLVVHKASVDNLTSAGVYSQKITYSIIANY